MEVELIWLTVYDQCLIVSSDPPVRCAKLDVAELRLAGPIPGARKLLWVVDMVDALRSHEELLLLDAEDEGR